MTRQTHHRVTTMIHPKIFITGKTTYEEEIPEKGSNQIMRTFNRKVADDSVKIKDHKFQTE